MSTLRERHPFLITRCALSMLPGFLLYEVCVRDIPVHIGSRAGPLLNPIWAKVVALIICLPVLIGIWTYNFGKTEDRVPDLDSGEVQTLLGQPRERSDAISESDGEPRQ
jgi:hypothetical protein